MGNFCVVSGFTNTDKNCESQQEDVIPPENFCCATVGNCFKRSRSLDSLDSKKVCKTYPKVGILDRRKNLTGTDLKPPRKASVVRLKKLSKLDEIKEYGALEDDSGCYKNYR